MSVMHGYGSDEQIVRTDTIPGLLKVGPYLCVSVRLYSRERQDWVAFNPRNKASAPLPLLLILCPMQSVPEFGQSDCGQKLRLINQCSLKPDPIKPPSLSGNEHR